MNNLSTLELNVVNQVNQYRNLQHKQNLQYDETISAIARSHSQAMANQRNASLNRRLVINHNGFNQRFKEIGKVFPRTTSAAENVAVNLNTKNPVKTAVDGWISSSGHEKNMVGNFTKTGVGIARSVDGAYFFTQLFSK